MTKAYATKGTQEWADCTQNLYLGCSNNCIYCYAKGIALRFGRITHKDEWKNMRLNKKQLNKRFNKRQGQIMFPSSHDITEETVGTCTTFLLHMLKPGNDLLVVTKAGLDVVRQLCRWLEPYQNQVEFRFTITSCDTTIAKVYEPDAPLISERVKGLVYARLYGYKTSVSIEPFLCNPLTIVDRVHKSVSNCVWVGPMNKRYCPPELWREDLWGVDVLKILSKQIEEYRETNPKVDIRLKDAFRNAIRPKKKGEA